jgi:GTP-binding protein
LFLIDSRAGVTPLDEEIGRWLRASDAPVVLAANKAEGRAGEAGLYDAYSLGLGEPIAISAEHGEGVSDLFDRLLPHLERDEDEAEEEGEGPLKLAIVGRPNAGKSTLINRILNEERLITGPEAGITRDSIAIDWQWQGPDGTIRPVRLIDTAGMRKKARVEDKLEKLSVADARRAIDFAEVVVLLLDATLGLEAQDLKIADRVLQEGRALIIAINKWDVAEDLSRLFQGIKTALGEGLSQAPGVTLLTVSAVTGKGIDTLINAAFEVRETWSKRVSTGQLNRWFEEAVDRNPPPAPGGKRIKLRYITQVNTRPPAFVVFGNRTDQLPDSYRRYLINGLRRELDFGAVPIRLSFRGSRNPYDK